MVIMKDSNVIDLSDTEVGTSVIVRTSESNGGMNNNMKDNDTVITKPERPTVTFDPNPTIHLTNSDGSPVKSMQKDGVKKVENVTTSKGGVAPSITNAQQAAVTQQATAAQQSKPDEPSDCYLKDLYSQVTSVVASKPDERENINEEECEDPAAVPMIWVSKWVDYSDKYGLGYQLCDESIGVLFNDFTKLLLLADGENIHYIERSSAEHYHQLKNYPAALNKKVTLLRYFRNYMNEHLVKAAASMCPREGDELARIPSLRTYFRTRSAIILHLTNGTLQINFFEDHTKIILCPLMGAVTYIDEKRNFRTYRLASLEKYGCRPDLANRLRYARNMIQKFLVTKSSTTKPSSASSSSSTTSTTQHAPTPTA
ncbi:serine/threonine-protein kinase PLK1-like isoform X2 [Homarus americanus]|uniref:serine/threonine-protein kinase PLK1-like isoform X2 n=1 Tax=Homarus americanus TaxID=6706 RepID=UPI001C4745AD|nr:serine/threonine-protein kinase PLK1-like isoform X2 [Homarus americanus]